ncbi:MAG: lycopene cyclase [Polyangiaceae bacterium]|jgi:lycopene beta-cyclase|nr:lycopene cyclase [Polyangiaceae bacterium]
MATTAQPELDFLLVGGGLGNALIALALFARRPGVKVGLVEQGRALGGNHLWCFHAGDVEEEAREFVSPLVSAQWPRYEVRFPELSRTLEEPYAAVRSERLDEVVRAAFAAQRGSRLFLECRAVHVTDRTVKLEDGRELRARHVIESRGPEALSSSERAGYQKFLGLEVKLKRPSPISHPVLMDALVPQRDGFRFLYALPFSSDRVLLEDTYFSDDKHLDRARLEQEILEYAAKSGFEVECVVREEVGILPLPTRLRHVPNPAPGGPLVAGYQGAWFHPVTGYSFPVAARLACAVARAEPDTLRERAWPRLVREQRAQLRFCLLLNKLFFGAFAPDQRRNVIERFYRLPPESVRRFYAMSLSHADRARILCGRPPRGFSLSRALSSSGGDSSPSSVRSTPGGALS